MEFQTVLIIFLSNLSPIFLQRLENAWKTSKVENLDTPSPEWIKYQQERFEHNVKTKLFQDPKKQQTQSVNTNPLNPEADKVETTSRQSSDYQEQEQAEFETMILNSQQSENPQESNGINSTNVNNGIQFPSIKGFIEFLNSLKETWMKNSIFRIDDKIKLLHKLKDNLMKTIEQQFMILWQDDDEDDHDHDNHDANTENIPTNQNNHHLRRKRGILDESSINFPPNAALMSINFLTFAVFLIKLVLQVVNIIKSKHYTLSTLTTDNGAIRNVG